jgi:hypothetical protein
MGGKKKVYQATWLQKVEPVYFAKDSAELRLRTLTTHRLVRC